MTYVRTKYDTHIYHESRLNRPESVSLASLNEVLTLSQLKPANQFGKGFC